MVEYQVTNVIFAISLVLTFVLALVGRSKAKKLQEDDLAGRSLNRWLVALSAGATANSGFVVTGAVGLGYTYGMQWIMLPVAWFLGDLIFWRWFPERINAFGHKSNAYTISEMLRFGLNGGWATTISLLAAILIILGLAGYTSAQWLAGQKFLSGAFGFSSLSALAAFALFIIVYSSIGGFRGSVYVDSFQAIIRVFGTAVVLGTAVWLSFFGNPEFGANFSSAGADFLNPFPGASVATAVGFVVGWAAAALGFGLGQPQILSRYLASSSPSETRSARWIYLSFVQITWVSMTIFGMLLRGIMPGIEDPEAGLSIFVQMYLFPAIAGVVIADVFGVIASTANSLLVAMSQSLKHDILNQLMPKVGENIPLSLVTFVVGLATMGVASVIEGSVVSLALSSVSMVGAGLAVPVMIKIMGWNHSGASITSAFVIGVASAVTWVQTGSSQYLNEAAVGMIFSLLTNWIVFKLSNTSEAKDT